MNNPRYINIGSGQKPYPVPWCNVDVQPRWSPDVCCDATKLPFDDNSAQVVVLEHVLEHFGCGEAKPMLREVLRVLKPGGEIVVSVPDVKRLVEEWRANRLTDQLLFTNLYGAYMGDEADRHKWGYTRSTLHELFWECGFFERLEPPEVAYRVMAHDWWILELCGRKPL